MVRVKPKKNSSRKLINYGNIQVFDPLRAVSLETVNGDAPCGIAMPRGGTPIHNMLRQTSDGQKPEGKNSNQSFVRRKLGGGFCSSHDNSTRDSYKPSVSRAHL